MSEITVTYTSIDRYRKKGKFKTLKGAQRFAQKWVGATPSLGSFYAVSFDGIGKVTVEGATLFDLFPEHVESKEHAQRAAYEAEMAADQETRAAGEASYACHPQDEDVTSPSAAETFGYSPSGDDILF